MNICRIKTARPLQKPAAMVRETIATVVSAAFVAGCATIESGPYGVALDSNNHPLAAATAAAGPSLKVSAGEISSLGSTYFGVVEVTFENSSPNWIDIDRVDIDFGTPDKNKSVLVPWGSQIDSWERATSQRNIIRATNEQTALAILALGGRLASARHHHSTAGAVGGLAAVGALAALEASSLQEAAEAAEQVPRFPDTHLLALPIHVPPGLFAKRWVLLYTAQRPLGGCIDSMILNYETSTHEHARVLLSFKAPSEWQFLSCGPPVYGTGNMHY